ncbi:MAG: DUF924 domain-containing protein [Bacteriovoracaceae bacterium]|nr:DUF924 domain-containing protein [Bacteriovoracaceae bacterium]
MKKNPHEVIDFWFGKVTPGEWFKKDEVLDDTIRSKFSEHLEAAKRGELYLWRLSPVGRLAEIILLDQFSRHIYRGTPQAFEGDSLALVLSQEMVLRDLDKELSIEKRSFAYMPYMHSESKLIHQEAMRIFSMPGLEESLKFEILHKEIIDQFGRYPHRNQILGRESSLEELEFLKTHPGF